MILEILLSCLVLFYLIVRFKYRRMYALSRKLNNDILTLPILGHLYLFIGNTEAIMRTVIYFGRKALSNGGLTVIWYGIKLFTVVADPVTADYLTKMCLEKDDITNLAKSTIGNGSIFAPVSIWRPRRKAVVSNFSLARLNNFVEIFSKQSHIMVKKLKKNKEKGTVAIFKYIVAYSMDSICESTLGIKVGAQSHSDHPFPKAFERNCETYVNKAFKPYIYETPFYKLTASYAEFVKNNRLMQDFVKTIIKSKRQKIENEEKDKTKSKQNIEDKNLISYLDMMIKTSGTEQGFSDVEIMEESLVLILAGTDTSATGAAFIAKVLSRHPEVQEKVYQELQAVFGDKDRLVTPEDLTRLKYLDAVVKEVIRLYPPVPITIRKIEKDVTIPSGITLVKDSSIFIHNWAINRNPVYWGEDAEEFKPDRFIDAPPKHPAAFATFSLGPRACIGYKYALMSIMTVTIYLVRNFKLLPCESSDICSYMDTGKCLEKVKPLRVKWEIMMKDVDDFKVRLEPRIKSYYNKY